MQSATLRNSALWICQSLGWSSATESACYYIWFPNAPGASTLHDRGAKPQVGQRADLQVLLHIGHLKHFWSHQVCQTFQILLYRAFSKLWIKIFHPTSSLWGTVRENQGWEKVFFLPFFGWWRENDDEKKSLNVSTQGASCPPGFSALAQACYLFAAEVAGF